MSEIKQQLSTTVTPEHIPSLAAVQSSSAQKITHAESQKVSVDISDEAFCQTVEQLKENIRAGDIFQVVPSRTFSIPCIDSIAALVTV